MNAKVDEMVLSVDKNVIEIANKMTKSMDENIDGIVSDVENKIDKSIAKTSNLVKDKMKACCVIN